MLSNFGTLAGRYGIPLVVPPAVAILGRGQGPRGRRGGPAASVARAPPHAAVAELRSSLRHRRRGVPLPGGRHRRPGITGIARRESDHAPCEPRATPQGSSPRSWRPRRRCRKPCARARTCRSVPAGVLRQRGRRGHRRAITGGAGGRGTCRTSQFARRRRGRALVRVFNPTLREHGYTSPHTVIEMVNDDMPFLVDSIGLALSRRAPHAAFSRAPDLRGGARPQPASCARSRTRRAATAEAPAARILPAHRGRPHRRSGGAASPERGDRARACATCARSCADWTKMRAAARQRGARLESP